MNIGLTTYGINIRNSKDENISINNISGESYVNIVEKFAEANLKKYDSDEQHEQVFTFDDVKRKLVTNSEGKDIYELLFLRIKSGEYGTESEIVDKNTGLVEFNKGPNDADVLPFGCCIVIPCGNYYGGVITLQSIGRYGIKTVLHNKLKENIRSIDSDLRMTMGTIVPKTYMENYLRNGILQSIRLIRYGIPDDTADKYGVDRGVRSIIEERVIKKPSGFLRNKVDLIRECMVGTKRYDEVVRIDDFEIDDLKLDFKLGNRSKVISMKNLQNLVVTEDITDKVGIQNGQPEFESLCMEMENTAIFYLTAMGLIDEKK